MKVQTYKTKLFIKMMLLIMLSSAFITAFIIWYITKWNVSGMIWFMILVVAFNMFIVIKNFGRAISGLIDSNGVCYQNFFGKKSSCLSWSEITGIEIIPFGAKNTPFICFTNEIDRSDEQAENAEECQTIILLRYRKEIESLIREYSNVKIISPENSYD